MSEPAPPDSKPEADPEPAATEDNANAEQPKMDAQFAPRPQFAPRRGLASQLAFLQNLTFFAVFFIPVAFVWFCIREDNQDTKDRKKEGTYVIMVAGSYFLLDCLVYPAVGLLPQILSPLLKVQTAADTANSYMQDSNMMIFGGVLLMLSVTSSGFTKRISYKILALGGGNLRKCNFVLMCFAATVSMWYPDSVVMFLLFDIVDAMNAKLKEDASLGVLGENLSQLANVDENNAVKSVPASSTEVEGESKSVLAADSVQPSKEDTTAPEATSTNPGDAGSKQVSVDPSRFTLKETKFLKLPVEEQNDNILDEFKLSTLHACAIVASISSMFWPFASTNSVVFKASLVDLGQRTNFGAWVTFSGPVVIIAVPIAVLYLDFFLFKILARFYKSKAGEWEEKNVRYFYSLSISPAAKKQLEVHYTEVYEALGAITMHEGLVLGLIVLTALTLPVSDQGAVGSWTSPVNKEVKTSTVVLLAAVLLFVIPNNGPGMVKGRKDPDEKPAFESLLGWKSVVKSFPWGYFIFVGGTHVLAKTAEVSGVDAEIAKRIEPMNEILLLGAIMVMIFLLACFVSSQAAARIAVDISQKVILIKSLKPEKTGTGVCFYAFPAVAVSCLAFIFPVGTPATSMVHYKTQRLSGLRCMMMGLPLSILFFCIIFGLAMVIKC